MDTDVLDLPEINVGQIFCFDIFFLFFNISSWHYVLKYRKQSQYINNWMNHVLYICLFYYIYHDERKKAKQLIFCQHFQNNIVYVRITTEILQRKLSILQKSVDSSTLLT